MQLCVLCNPLCTLTNLPFTQTILGKEKYFAASKFCSKYSRYVYDRGSIDVPYVIFFENASRNLCKIETYIRANILKIICHQAEV